MTHDEAIAALIALRAKMQGDIHHNLVDIPVSVNLDAWIEELDEIIEALRTPEVKK